MQHLTRLILLLDRGAASIRAICSSICSCYHSCTHGFTLLRCCISKRFVFYAFCMLIDSFLLTHFAVFSSDPTYVVAPVLKSRSGRQEMKKLFAGTIFSHSTPLVVWFSITTPLVVICLIRICSHFYSLVWKETNEEDIFSITWRSSSSLSWIWMDPGNTMFWNYDFALCFRQLVFITYIITNFWFRHVC